ncbi:MAG: RIP metalloprotease RseP [candidate division Zixibacteria bacterium]|nr:RIP metalloprotease RseP [candidate division Zixibacteria bacterium]
MLTAVSFIFVLGVLIFIHELGHFVVAKKVGIKVHKFSLGFPPNIFSKKVGDTTYCIGLIPLGGYVKMAGEDPNDESSGADYEFASKTIGQRTAVIFAGPFMNYLLAIFLMIGVLYFGGRPIFDNERIIVGTVQTDAPADKAGLKEDDVIIAFNGQAVSNFDSLRIRINSKIEEQIEISWLSDGTDTTTVSLTTKQQLLPRADGGFDTVGIIGFSPKPIGYEHPSLVSAAVEGFVVTHVIVRETFKFIKQLVTGQASTKMIGGPLFIAQQSGKEASKGAANLFFFMALLSVNLAVLNIMPIPILDGGHLVFLAIEKLKGSPLSIKVRGIAQQVGMVLLFTMIIFVTYNDILRAFKGQ